MSTVEHREALWFVGMPLDVAIDRLPAVAGEQLDRVADLLAGRGIVPRGEVIRYVAARPDGMFSVEIGHLVDPAELEDTPLAADELPAGRYSVARHDGPYADLGRVTRELMDSWEPAGVRPAFAHTTTGDEYACWYERYLDMPREGPRGLEGAVEVCVLLAGS